MTARRRFLSLLQAVKSAGRSLVVSDFVKVMGGKTTLGRMCSLADLSASVPKRALLCAKASANLCQRPRNAIFSTQFSTQLLMAAEIGVHVAALQIIYMAKVRYIKI